MEFLWLESAKSLRLRDDLVEYAVKCKIAHDDRFHLWFETAARRQFSRACSSDECKEISGGLDMQGLFALLCDALEGNDTASEVFVTMKLQCGEMVLTVKWKTKYFEKDVVIHLSERRVQKVDRLEAWLEEVVEKSDGLEQRVAKVEAPDLSKWTLRVVKPYYPPESDGSCGHFQLCGNHFLIQDSDYKAKRTGVSTDGNAGGVIYATLMEAADVTTIKIAPFPACGWGHLSSDQLVIEIMKPDSYSWTSVKTIPANSTEEHIADVNTKIIACRLRGTYVSISKLIFM